ncbi:hypothetical protein B4098_1798 [Heyndrickxia coagulans]|uniref:Uncharacterized protein n=1 Tax=Heyndrickxia coagulans TaxID=1398 RepID=A0A150KAS2_HEYCO|nr:hypothetical protein B4098_1798 [Heyndrickxia coagulans]
MYFTYEELKHPAHRHCERRNQRLYFTYEELKLDELGESKGYRLEFVFYL